MQQPKPLSKNAVPRALEKAERYRLLNEPAEAESICLDVLGVDPENQTALVTLLLALTDQFETALGERHRGACEVLQRLGSEYARAYYAGLIAERRAKAELQRGGPGSGHMAYDSLQDAMGWYAKAEALRPPDNDDAVLRWNTCVRLLARHPELQPRPRESAEQPLE